MLSTTRVFAALLMGGLGLAAGPGLAAVHTVNQVGFTFEPNDITITVGDTVEWVWSTSIHTVTNGTDFADPGVGTVFDDPLSSANTQVTFTFTQTGDVPYFCRPHLGLGMTGIVRVTGLTPVGEIPSQAGFVLQQNTPNPFNPRTVIPFTLAQRTAVNLRIFDLSGRLVRVVLEGIVQDEGPHEAAWNGRDHRGRMQPAGVYFYRLEAGGFSETRTMSLLK